MSVILLNAQSHQVAYESALAPLPSTGQAVSGAAWVYPRTMTGGQRQAILTLEGVLPAAPALSFEINTAGPGTLGVVRGDPAGTTVQPLRLIGVPNTLGAGVAARNRGWHHVAFTYNGGVNTTDIRLFVDGVEVDNFVTVEQENLPPPPAGTGTVTLGACGNAPGLDGAVSDVGLWYGRELTPAEIASLAGRSESPVSIGGAGLVFAPSFAVNLHDPVSDTTGVAGSGVVIEETVSPRVQGGLIAAYDARSGLVNTFAGLTWTDASGGGNTLVQASGSNQPSLLASATPSGLPAVSFDPYIASFAGAKWMGTTSPTSAELPSDHFTVVYVGSARLLAGAGGGSTPKYLQAVLACPNFALRVGGPLTSSLRDSELAYTDSINPNGVFAGTTVKAVSSPAFMAWRGSGTSTVDFTCIDRASTASRVPSPATAATAWRLGGAWSGNLNGFLGNAHVVLLYNRRLTEAELGTLRGSLAAVYDVPMVPRRVVVVEGSSSAAGYSTSFNRDYAWRSIESRHDIAYNFARGGDDVSSNGAADVRQQAAQSVDLVVRPGLPNLLMLQIGSNDLISQPAGNDQGRAQAVFNNIKQYCLARKAAGFTRIGVITLLSRSATGTPAGQSGFENRRRILNDLLRANIGQGYDEVIDFAEDPLLGADSAFSLYPWLYADGTHLNAEGFNLCDKYLRRFMAAPVPRVPDSEPLILK
ncbi:MAG: LamG-like jellyroll fold domain-containing protein [Phycisphaerales bacterium]